MPSSSRIRGLERVATNGIWLRDSFKAILITSRQYRFPIVLS